LGGAKFLAPIINEIDPKLQKLIVNPISKIFVENFFPDIKYELLDVGKNTIEDFWQMRVPAYSSVISTTSSKMIDKANASLIKVCRDNSIPTLGFLDHWKGFDRFFDDNNQPAYLPDWLGVIDEKTKSRLESLKSISSSIFVIGHPWLDFLKQINNKKAICLEPRSILLVSQPDPLNKFVSIFCEKDNQSQINEYLSLMEAKGYNAFYRAHPKEVKSCYGHLPLDKTNFLDVFDKYEIFIGYDSMMLLEAFMSGKKVLCLKPNNMKNTSDYKIPIKYGNSLDQPFSKFPLQSNLFENSIVRGKELIESFLRDV
tara:strand:- start:836 stop:1774 length:939 start_codon:yes stop_codon:yes gene_type:complete